MLVAAAAVACEFCQLSRGKNLKPKRAYRMTVLFSVEACDSECLIVVVNI